MNIVKKIRKMSAKQIILAMVEGLENPTTEINMNSFGISTDNVCFGCAATNTICRIEKINSQKLLSYFNKESGNSTGLRNYHFKNKNKETKEFISTFEYAIDYLRQGLVKYYNIEAKNIGIAVIEIPKFNLPFLENSYTLEELNIYKKLADEHKNKKRHSF